MNSPEWGINNEDGHQDDGDMIHLKDANLRSVKAIVYSRRFWQYYFINFLTHFSYYES